MRRTVVYMLWSTAVLAASRHASAWSGPLPLSDAPLTSEPSVPRIAYGDSGRLLVVYQQKPEWRVYYRERSSTGNASWQPIEILGTDFCPGRPDVIEDGSGRAHVVFPQRGAGGTYDLMHAIKQNGVWTTTAIMSTGGTSDFEDYPRLARDSSGRIHLLYTRATDPGAGDVCHRVWNGGAWSAETIIGQVSQAYYQRPDVSVDPSGRIHAVWVVNGGYRNLVKYSRYDGGAWSVPVNIGQSTPQGTSGSFISYVRVAAATANNIVAVWHDDNSSSQPSILVHSWSTNGGAAWSPQQTLVAGHLPGMHGGNGRAYLVCTQQPSGTSVLYMTWDGVGWSPAQTATPPSSYWKGWADVTDDAEGYAHIVYDDVVDGNNRHQISYVTNLVDTTPPGPVTRFVATAHTSAVHLSWTNPGDLDFKGTMIRYKTTGYPTGTSDGTLVCDRQGLPGSNGSFDHTGLTNGVTCYYTAFSYDDTGHYAAGVTASATPSGNADFDGDTDVDLQDFALFQACFGGPNAPPNLPGCAAPDLDGDFDVDLVDFSLFQACFNGPNRPPSCT